MVTIIKKSLGVEGASLLGAGFQIGSKKILEPKSFRLVIEPGRFSHMAFSAALRGLSANGIRKEQIEAVDFIGSVKGSHLKKYVRNSAGLVLGDRVEVRFNVPEKECNKSVIGDITKVRR